MPCPLQRQGVYQQENQLQKTGHFVPGFLEFASYFAALAASIAPS